MVSYWLVCVKNIEDQTVAPYSEQGSGALHSKNLENEWTAVYFNLKKIKYVIWVSHFFLTILTAGVDYVRCKDFN